MADFKDIAPRALEIAKKYGAQSASASVSHSQSIEIDWRKQKVETLSSSGQSSIFLQLYVDGRFGSYRTSDLRDEPLEQFISKNIEMTRLLEPDPARALPDPARYADRAQLELQLFDPKIRELSASDGIERCRAMEDVMRSHSEVPISDITTSWGIDQSHSIKANSNGFYGTKEGTSISTVCQIVMADGEKKPSDYAYSQARFASDLKPLEAICAEAAKFGAYRLNQKKIASGRRTLIVDRRCAALLISRFIAPMYGAPLVQKQSYFDKKIGVRVASELFDLHDEPHLLRGMGSRLFDAEGMTSHRAPLFDKGVLRQYFLDTYAARKLQMEATTGDASNLVLTPGKRPLDAMVADVDDGIYVIGFLGGNQDGVRGDFSYGIVGVAIEKGRLTTHVSEMNITGNFLELMSQLTEVGNDPRTDSALQIPSLRFENVSCSGV